MKFRTAMALAALIWLSGIGLLLWDGYRSDAKAGPLGDKSFMVSHPDFEYLLVNRKTGKVYYSSGYSAGLLLEPPVEAEVRIRAKMEKK